MNKTEIVEQAACDAGITKAEAAKAFESIVESIKESLKKGEKTMIVGFGTFSVTERSAQTGRNPQTGEKISIAAKKVPKFTASSSLKEAVG